MAGVSTARFREIIEEYFNDCDLDITYRKRRRGYSLYFTDDNEPFARVCPTGDGDIVEVNWWDGFHWHPVTEFGVALPLTEALDYIMKDPEDVFFRDHDADEDDDEGDDEDYETDEDDPRYREVMEELNRDMVPLLAATAIREAALPIFTYALFGSACGGMATGSLWGLTFGGGAAIGFCLLHSLIGGRIRYAVAELLLAGLPALLLGGAGGALGASAVAAIGGGIWFSLVGALIAAACVFVGTLGRTAGWLIGFTAGLNLGVSLAESMGVRDQFAGAAVIAVTAACIAPLCRTLGGVLAAELHDPNRRQRLEQKLEQ